MNYYDQIINKPGCACRPWPLMPASDADNEIARLRAHVSQLREDNRELRSINKALIWANEQLKMLLTVAVSKSVEAQNAKT